MARPDPFSVLVVDEEPSILAVIARILDSNGIRPLLARSAQEATEIANRAYVPIDLILTDVAIKNSAIDPSESGIGGTELVSRLRKIRPDTRVLYMSAYLDAGVIRIQLMNRWLADDGDRLAEGNLIASIEAAASAPFAFSSGGAPLL